MRNLLNKRILFISHDASLTGAPVLLINLMTLLKRQGGFDFTVVLMRGGELEAEFGKICEVYVVKHSKYGKRKSIFYKILDFLVMQFRMIPVYYKAISCDFIFNNTVANGRVIRQLRFTGKPVMTYVHEMKSTIEAFQKNRDAFFSFKYSDLFLSPSKSVVETLANEYFLNRSSILPLNYYFPAFRTQPGRENVQKARINFAEKFKLDPNDFWVVGMGTATPRKGIDIFVEVCSNVIRQSGAITFVWIGEFLDSKYKKEIEDKIRGNNLGNRLVFTGKMENGIDVLKPFDLFLLTSREDPYPLVVLEAAYNSIPAVCFDGSGGIAEFVEEDAGWLISDFSVSKMSTAIIQVSYNKQELSIKGAQAQRKVLAKHSEETHIMGQFENAIKNLKAKGNVN